MYIKVRGPDCSRIEVVYASKLMLVKELKQIVSNLFDVEPTKQRLIYRGKQLEDEYTLFDYDVQLNEVLQLIVKQNLPPKEVLVETPKPVSLFERLQGLPKLSESKYFRVGEVVDFMDPIFGAWFEGKIKNIYLENEKLFEELGGSATKGRNNCQSDNSAQSEDSNITSSYTQENIEKSKDIQDGEYLYKRLSSSITDEEATKLHESDNKENNSSVFCLGNQQPSSKPSSVCTERGGLQEIKNNVVQNQERRESNLEEIAGSSESKPVMDDGCLYEIVNLSFVGDMEMLCKLSEMRPKSNQSPLTLADIVKGQNVLVNYNIQEPSMLGYWFDFVVSGIENTRTKKAIKGELHIYSKSGCKINNVTVTNVSEIWKPEELCTLEERGERVTELLCKRPVPPMCDRCNDKPSRKCKACSCQVCGGKNEPSKQIMCDECDSPFHLWCLDPPLQEIPEEDEWFCPDCKIDENEIVKAGEKLKSRKKKDNQRSKISGYTKWGKGMANVGRSKVCTIVPPDHFGPIPGVEVGTCWRFRIQASEAGVHRPPVSGMHGREDVGAFSIVLSGGYEDDEDFGESFWYTGAGGRDLSGNKRTSVQSCDQLLTSTNKALALNCNAPLSEKGAKAKDWQKGKPVRVIRSYKLKKHSKYAPEQGLRYDGLYKVVEYRPEKGKSGYIVWKYLLRRDDPSPAPWTPAGKKLIASLGLELQVPENYEVAVAKKESSSNGKTGKKRKMATIESCFANKKLKIEPYVLSDDLKALIAKDTKNAKLWDVCSSSLADGKKKFLEALEENFSCICCQELLHEPVTTPCFHNFCKGCMQRAFKAEVFTCPACRHDLTKDFRLKTNEELYAALKSFFPGYEVGR